MRQCLDVALVVVSVLVDILGCRLSDDGGGLCWLAANLGRLGQVADNSCR